MSTYEWERGKLKLPAKAFAGFRRALIVRYNEIMEARFQAAGEIYLKLKEAGKGKRNFNWEGAFNNIQASAPSKYEGIEFSHLFTHFNHTTKKPIVPQRKSFPRLMMSATTIPVDGEAIITFNPAEKSVEWDVPENNHAVEIAHESSIARAFFKALNEVKWTRGSGGVIVGNNEYNDGDQPGDGGNYVTYRFGPLREKAQRR